MPARRGTNVVRLMGAIGMLLFSVGADMASMSARAQSSAEEATHVTRSLAVESWSLEERIGQLFLVGVHSLEQVRKLKPGGVVLFAWNMKSVEGTRKLTRELRELAAKELKAPLFIAIDHEGGQVLRLRRGLTNFPDAAAMGATGDPFLSFKAGKAMGLELSSLGVNMNLAPVLDLGNARSFLQNRVWGSQGSSVSEMTTAFIRGLHAGRILAVAKHFPGHGRSSVDAHFKLPRLLVSEEQLWKEDLEPFRRATQEGVQAVMTAHVEIPVVDTVPASLSKRFITTLLRERIGYQGLVVTDDLEMGGVDAWGDAGDVALRALSAGSDMILVVWSVDAQRKAAEKVRRAVLSGALPEAELNAKVRRILEAKAHLVPLEPGEDENPFWKENLRRPESLRLAEDISQRAVSWVGGNPQKILRQVATQWQESWEVFLPSEAAAEEWRRHRGNDLVRVWPRRPDGTSLEHARNDLRKALQGTRPSLIVTGPRASSSDDVFQVVRKAMSERLRQPNEVSRVIWAHQGTRPVEVQRNPASLNIGLVSLHTSSRKGISALLKSLREGALRYLPLHSKN